MNLRANGKEFCGASALEIVRAMEHAADDYPYKGRTLWQFLLWSVLKQFPESISLGGLGLSTALPDETLALSYLYLCDQYELGELCDAEIKAEA